jgi:hypothetical protein
MRARSGKSQGVHASPSNLWLTPFKIRRTRPRMCGGVGAGRGSPPGEPIRQPAPELSKSDSHGSITAR